jgi:hypothetical protein
MDFINMTAPVTWIVEATLVENDLVVILFTLVYKTIIISSTNR